MYSVSGEMGPWLSPRHAGVRTKVQIPRTSITCGWAWRPACNSIKELSLEGRDGKPWESWLARQAVWVSSGPIETAVNNVDHDWGCFRAPTVGLHTQPWWKECTPQSTLSFILWLTDVFLCHNTLPTLSSSLPPASYIHSRKHLLTPTLCRTWILWLWTKIMVHPPRSSAPKGRQAQ